MLTYEKNLVPNKSKWRLARLSDQDLEAVHAFECSTFPEAMQANYQTLASRFALNHFMFGAWEQDRLIGLASWRHAWFDPKDSSAFPKTFAEFSGGPNSDPYNAVFVYNLGIHPAKRGTQLTRALINGVLEHIEPDHCKYLVGDGRCPSYNGSDAITDRVTPSKVFRAAVDHHLQSGEELSLADYLSDPFLRFYYRMLDCRFLWTMPDFLPSDSASGGHRVIFYKLLNKS